MSNVTTSNWLAWISKQPAQQSDSVTLHVTGEVDTHSEDFVFLHKRVPQGFNPAILLLELKIENGIVPAKNPQRVHYTKISKKQSYTSIEIFLEGKIIKEIKDIPKVI